MAQLHAKAANKGAGLHLRSKHGAKSAHVCDGSFSCAADPPGQLGGPQPGTMPRGPLGVSGGSR
jgi:hypothetical protein